MEAQTRVAQLLASIDEAFDRRSWHGTNLRGSIRGLPRAIARWRPAPGRHNVWEIVVHAAYWKYAVRRRLTGEKRGTFALAGSNFWRRPEEDSDAAWKRDVMLLVAEHTALRQAIADFPATKLARRTPGGTTTYEWLIRGIAAHDVYHAGQIQLLKRLASDAAR
jgi:uncharacterized damage-inducible protein DinB